MKNVNIWDSYKGTGIIETLHVKEALNRIQYPNLTHKELINSINLNNKKEYDRIKSILPAVTWNFNFKERRNYDNIDLPTGLMYIDIDCSSQEEARGYKEQLKECKYIHAVWISLSKNGVGAILNIDGITKENFDSAYNKIMGNFNIPYDKLGGRRVQSNTLSYDPDIYINENAETYIYNEEEDEETIPVYDLDTKNQINISGLRFQLLLDDYPKECIHFPEGKQFFKAYWPFEGKGKIKKATRGNRNHILSCFINNLVLLNPEECKMNSILGLIKYFNRVHVIPKLDDTELLAIFNFKWNNKDKLSPIDVKLKYYWIDPNVSNKIEIFHKSRKNITKSKIEDWLGNELYNQTEKITQNKLAKFAGVSVITIRRYWNEYKETIEEFNRTLPEKKRKNYGR